MPYADLHRRSIRLQGFDYRQSGAYFITLASSQHEDVFGIRVKECVTRNAIGVLVSSAWLELPNQFSVTLDEWVLMPDHLHAILFLENNVAEGCQRSTGQISGTQPGSLGSIIQNFKAVTTRKINRIRHTPGRTIWQRNYYERVIRNDRELDSIRGYIMENPLRHYLRQTEAFDL